MSEIQQPKIKKKGAIWIIWLIPIIAFIFASWMSFDYFKNSGEDIIVTVDDASGFILKKTPLSYKGVSVGSVKSIEINQDDFSKIDVTVRVEKHAIDSLLREGTKIWRVSPKLSLTEVSGLSSMLPGPYLEIMPAVPNLEMLKSLPKQTVFTALNEAPENVFKKGMLLYLESKSKISASAGTPILYNKQIVGKVVKKVLKDDYETSRLSLLIKKKYVTLIKDTSTFHEISGLDIKASLSGVKIKMDSLSTLVAGGISFDSPPGKSVEEKHIFKLYENAHAPLISEKDVVLNSDQAHELNIGESKVYFKGVEVGFVKDLDFNIEEGSTKIFISFDKKYRHLANSSAYFWIVKPELGFNKINGLDAIVKGKYITFSANKHGVDQSEFLLHNHAPTIKGKRILLSAPDAGSLKVGGALFYKNLEVGVIESIKLHNDKQQVNISLKIFQKYRSLVNDSTLFYNSSGVEIDASLAGVKVNIGSLENTLRGGISFQTADFSQKSDRSSFILHVSKSEIDDILYRNSGGMHIYLSSATMGSIKSGAPILYKKIPVGKVLSYSLDHSSKNIIADIYIEKKYTSYVNNSTKFYNASGVEAKISLGEIAVNTESLSSMMSGGIAFYTPDIGTLTRDDFELYNSYDEAQEDMTEVIFSVPKLSGIKVGSRIHYNEMEIGKIASIGMHDETFELKGLVDPRYKHYICQDAYVWTESVSVSINGVKNLESALRGSVIKLSGNYCKKAVEELPIMSTPPSPHFSDEGLRVTLRARRLGSLNVGSPLFYRQIQIGTVEKINLVDDASAVDIELFIKEEFAYIIRNNSKFYYAGGLGVEISLTGMKVKTETLSTLMQGGINVVTPPEYTKKAKMHARFFLNLSPDDAWLNWTPSITK